MVKAVCYIPFVDKHTGKSYKSGKNYQFTEERVKEIKSFDPGLIGVVEVIPDKNQDETSKEETSEDETAGADPVTVPPVPGEKTSEEEPKKAKAKE